MRQIAPFVPLIMGLCFLGLALFRGGGSIAAAGAHPFRQTPGGCISKLQGPKEKNSKSRTKSKTARGEHDRRGTTRLGPNNPGRTQQLG
jgi:hypothetical protein